MQPDDFPPRRSESPPLRGDPNDGQKTGFRRVIGFLVAAGVLILNFGGKLKFIIAPLLKFFPVILKSGGTMLLTIGVYTAMWGWKFAVGFVLLIFVHELGHLVAAKQFNLPVGAPVFIPFMGAFIALKEAPKNAWIEACVGIGGPLLGTAGALVCHGIGLVFDAPLFVALAWVGYWLNLFNLTPIGYLDGGRIVTALSPWLWIPGLAIVGWMAWTRPNIIIWLVLLMSLPRVFSLFRQKTDDEKRYFEVTRSQRWGMGALYFGLIAALVFAMDVSEQPLENLDNRDAPGIASAALDAVPQ